MPSQAQLLRYERRGTGGLFVTHLHVQHGLLRRARWRIRGLVLRRQREILLVQLIYLGQFVQAQGLLHRRLLRAQMLRVPARDTHDEGRRERARRPWREEQQQ
jgi:hypothetical protein